MLEWLNTPAPLYVIIITICWAVLSAVSTMYWIDKSYSKNPFKNMWMCFDEARYNLAGKIILCVINTIIGAPCALVYYCIELLGFCIRKLRDLFDLIFKKEDSHE